MKQLVQGHGLVAAGQACTQGCWTPEPKHLSSFLSATQSVAWECGIPAQGSSEDASRDEANSGKPY